MAIDINDLTLGQIKELVSQFGAAPEATAKTSLHIGKKCIVRTYASGVHFGTVLSVDGRSVDLCDARRLWRWDAAPHGVSLSEIANHGTVGDRSKVCEVVKIQGVLDAIEIIPCTPDAIAVIEAAKVHKP